MDEMCSIFHFAGGLMAGGPFHRPSEICWEKCECAAGGNPAAHPAKGTGLETKHKVT
jgi:hypothetical protein